MQGCRSPLVVKLADSQKEKEMKRLQQMQAQLLNGAGAVGLGALSQQYLAVSITQSLSVLFLVCFICGKADRSVNAQYQCVV